MNGPSVEHGKRWVKSGVLSRMSPPISGETEGWRHPGRRIIPNNLLDYSILWPHLSLRKIEVGPNPDHCP